MAPAADSATDARKTVPSQHALFDSLVGIVTKHVNEHLMAVATRLVAALLDVSDPAVDARAVYQRVKSGNLLKNNSYAFFHLAAGALEQAVRKEMALLLPLKKGPAAPAQAMSLVPYEEMDSRVAFNAISRPFEISYAEALATLNVRLAYLLERESLRIGQNPFRPEVFLMALNAAWCDFEPDVEAHELLAPLLRPAILFDFAPLYEALNLALMRKGVLPGSVDSLRIRKTDNAAAAAAKRASEKGALSEQLRQFFADGEAAGAAARFDAAIPMVPDLPAMPQGGGGWRPSGAAAFCGVAPAYPPSRQRSGGAQQGGEAGSAAGYNSDSAAGYNAGVEAGRNTGGAALPNAGAPLLALLAQLQRSMPDELVGRVGATTSSTVREQAGAASQRNVFYLPRLKESLPKGSLSRGDENTIDLLSRIFETVFLDDNIPQETRELIQSMQIPVLKAALQDKDFFFQETHPARRMIDLMSRMGWEQRCGADDPMLKVMRRSVERVGRDCGHEPAPFAEAVDELEASMQAQETAAAAALSAPIAAALKQEKIASATRSARNAVALRVGKGEVLAIVETFLADKWTAVLTVAYSVEGDKPGAVGNAVKTMDELIWSVKPKISAEQRREMIVKLPGLLSQLNKWLDVIQWRDADRLRFFAELAECHAAIVRAPIDLSPERQLEVAIEVAQQDALRRIAKEDALAEREAAEVDEVAVAVDGLERGMWMAFTLADASVRKVKLAWISPLRTLYIFSTGARQEAFSMSAEKLAETIRAARVKVIGAEGVVARALSQAMDAAVNDAAMRESAVA